MGGFRVYGRRDEGARAPVQGSLEGFRVQGSSFSSLKGF